MTIKNITTERNTDYITVSCEMAHDFSPVYMDGYFFEDIDFDNFTSEELRKAIKAKFDGKRNVVCGDIDFELDLWFDEVDFDGHFLNFDVCEDGDAPRIVELLVQSNAFRIDLEEEILHIVNEYYAESLYTSCDEVHHVMTEGEEWEQDDMRMKLDSIGFEWRDGDVCRKQEAA